MEILQLKYFCDAAEEENFSKAARKYGLPPSNISQTVHRLETELGVCLFDRSANRIVLNKRGKIFHEKVKQALKNLDDAVRAASDEGELSQKDIRLKVCTNRRIVTTAIESFKRIYPDVNFILSHNYNDVGEFDFVISDMAPEGENYKGELLVTEKIVLAANNDLLCVKTGNVSLADLRADRFITMPDKTSLCRITNEICNRAGFEANIVIKSDDPFYLRRYIELGLGIAFVPSFSWMGMFSEKVGFFDVCDYTRYTYVFYDAERYIPAFVKAFKDLLFEVTRAEQQQ